MSAVIQQRSEIEEEDELRIEQRLIEREGISEEQRAAEREQIEELVGACGQGELIIEDTDRYDQLIAAGLVPITDPFTQQEGVPVDDLVAIHGICMSRTSVLHYLDANRYNYNNAPRMPSGLPITPDDLQNHLGLNPNDYGFFNPNLPRQGPAPAVEPLDLEALGLDEAEANAAAQAFDNAMNEDNPVIIQARGQSQFATAREAESTYLQELTRVALSYENFVRRLTQPFTTSRVATRRYFDAENHSLFSRMGEALQDFIETTPAAIDSARVAVLFGRKAFYLLNTYRDHHDRRYNIFRRDNEEILSLILRRTELPVYTLARHAHQVLQFPFIEVHSDRLSAYFTDNVAFRTRVIGDHPIEELVVNLRSPRIPRLLEIFLTQRRELGLQLTRQLAGDQVFFNRVFQPTETGRTVLPIDLVASQSFLINANQPRGEITLRYEPQEFDLFYHIAERPEWVGRLVANYRGDSVLINRVWRRLVFDISSENWRSVEWTVNNPASLRALLAANTTLPANRADPETMDSSRKQQLLSLADNTDSQYILRFYFGMIPRNQVDRERVGLPQVLDLTEE